MVAGAPAGTRAAPRWAIEQLPSPAVPRWDPGPRQFVPLLALAKRSTPPDGGLAVAGLGLSAHHEPA
jgi:hypothetical protein